MAASFRTCNIEQDLLNAVIAELIRMEEWKAPNPLSSVRQFKLHEEEMQFLTLDEIKTLLSAAAQHQHQDILKVVKVSLATGGRFLEIANLQGSQLSKYKITYTKTKGKKNRTVPISEALYDKIYKEDAVTRIPCSTCKMSPFLVTTKWRQTFIIWSYIQGY